ncbi:nucleic acid binding OB-fold tRNA/helicase-type [Methanocaldococcus vulcanius M7]|uniref:Nucleic acid binding OB-fold tRNA/helicase-type n=2 Tax=Methanocaldococcus TaxID=196118 RepID=C9RHK9_METVM|nr:nucleic acid binding OB-fold tRNA/helicase-type [Methanocaldococcus vulcanius M7]
MIMTKTYEQFKDLKRKIAEELNISEDELDKLIEKKIEESGGIILKDAALMMIANEKGLLKKEDKSEKFQIKDIKEGQIGVEIVGVVVETSDLKTFTRKDGSVGKYKRIRVADASGAIRITLWDDLAETEVEKGDVIKVERARARKWKNNIELSSTSETKIKKLENHEEELPEIKDKYKIEELIPGTNAVIEGEVISVFPIKEFKKSDGSFGKLKSITVKDDSGTVRITLWDDLAETEVEKGDIVRVEGYVKEGYYGGVECSANNIEILEKGERKDVDEVDIEKLSEYNDGDMVDVKGRVIAISNKKRVNLGGREAEVQDIILQNGTGKVRVSFWGDKTSLLDNIREGDAVKIKNCRIKTYYDREGNKKVDLVATFGTEVIKDKNIEVPEYKLDYCKIGDIYKRNVDWDDINLIARVLEDYGINELEIDGKIRKVRNLMLDDGSGTIRLTLWDDLAEMDIKEGDILEINHAYVKEKGDYIDLVLGKYAKITINPQGVEIKTKRKFIADIEDNETVEVRGAIVKILSEGVFLYLCPHCRRKIEEGENICPNCGEIVPDEIIRLNFVVDDGTGTLICRVYDKKVERMLKMSKEELKNIPFEMIESELLGEEFVFYGNVRKEEEDLIMIVKRVEDVDVDKEIKLLKEMED